MKQFDPAMMALLSAGAGMMDPTGTYGSSGARFNKGVQQGMATYLPMAQFEARKKEAATRRKDVKEQNQLRNTLLERQIELQEANAKRMATQWESTHNLNVSKYGLMEKQYQAELDKLEATQEMMGQFTEYATQGVPTAASQQPPMKISGAGVPYGDLPQRAPMTPQQFGGMQAQMMSGTDVPAGAFSALNKSAFPSHQPGSPNYSVGDRRGYLEYKDSMNQTTPQEKAELDNLRTSAQDPMAAAIAKMIERSMPQ